MKRSTFKFVIASLIFVFGMSLVLFQLGCGQKFARDPYILVRRLAADASKLNPVLYTDAYSGEICDWIFPPLVTYNDKFELQPELAEGWVIEEKAHFYLKGGLSAQDVYANFMKALDEGKVDRNLIDDVKVVAPDEIVVTLTKFKDDAYKIMEGVIPEENWRKITRVKVVFHGKDVGINQDKPPYKCPWDSNKNFTVGALVKKMKEDVKGGKLPIAYVSFLTKVSFEFLYLDELNETKAWEVVKAYLPDGIKEARFVRLNLKRIWDQPLIVFKLRKGIKWHDGTEVTADDVKFTYEKVIDPNTATVRASTYRDVREVKVLDKYTLSILYNKPYAPCVSSWYMIVPKHIFEKEPDFNNSKYNREPVGCGPYKFVKWVSDSYIELEAVDTYWRGKPPFKKMIFKILPNNVSAFNELLAGQIDILGLTPYQWKFQTNNARFLNNFNKYKYMTPGYGYIGYNLDPEKCKLFLDKRVRQALSYAIDRDAIIKALDYGLGEKCYSPIHPSSWAYNPNVKKYEYNPELAKKLLAEAGWKDVDGDGILEKDVDGDGKLDKFRFTLMTSAGSDDIKKRAELIQSYWKKIGVDCQLKFIEWTVFLKNYVYPRNFEAIMLGWALGMDPDQYSIWASDQIEGGFNRIGYVNPEVDKILEEARETFDREKRKKLYWKFQEIIAEDCPYTFLMIGPSLVAVHKRILNAKPTAIGLFSYDNFYKWHVDPAYVQK